MEKLVHMTTEMDVVPTDSFSKKMIVKKESRRICGNTIYIYLPISNPTDDWPHVVLRATYSNRVRSAWMQPKPDKGNSATQLMADLFGLIRLHQRNSRVEHNRLHSSLISIRDDALSQLKTNQQYAVMVDPQVYYIPWNMFVPDCIQPVQPALSVDDPQPDEMEMHADQFDRATISASLEENKRKYVHFLVLQMRCTFSSLVMEQRVAAQKQAMRQRFQFDAFDTLGSEAKVLFVEFKKNQHMMFKDMCRKMLNALHHPDRAGVVLEVEYAIESFCVHYDGDQMFIQDVSRKVYEQFCYSLNLHLPQLTCPPDVLLSLQQLEEDRSNRREPMCNK
jgi:hypothetical protein